MKTYHVDVFYEVEAVDIEDAICKAYVQMKVNTPTIMTIGDTIKHRYRLELDQADIDKAMARHAMTYGKVH